MTKPGRHGKYGENGDNGLSEDGMKAEVRDLYLRQGGQDIWIGFTTDHYPYVSAARPPTCPEGCETCSDQYVPDKARQYSDDFPLSMHDDDQAKTTIADLIASTEKNHAYVRAKIDSYGNGIAKRWQKKTTAQRAAMLKAARPNMCPDKLADAHTIHHFVQAVQAGADAKRSSVDNEKTQLSCLTWTCKRSAKIRCDCSH
ncbi:hypothetical protein LTR37_011226 [Vermiconidia calcicola]|uniref:Uncharacterized protein n=1 Tax=Vermiconidia calcicola TaxID=1690605 RepID=A0ACC3N2Q6_9PEZI|nr:hypothetical protein LTR37_011226 [Vermiconidia calcicola]